MLVTLSQYCWFIRSHPSRPKSCIALFHHVTDSFVNQCWITKYGIIIIPTVIIVLISLQCVVQ